MVRPSVRASLQSLNHSRRYLQTSTSAFSSTPTSTSTTSATSPPLYPHTALLSYSIGLSYASKDSPPFVHPKSRPKPYGFASNTSSKGDSSIGTWVREMLELPAGRGDLRAGEKGGWSEKLDAERKAWGAGEDFFAISHAGKDVHLAMSDGVGGWSSSGVDPSLFSQGLMYHYSQSLFALSHGGAISVEPKQVLKVAYDALLNDQSVKAGGGTAVGVRLKSDGEAMFANLGDSGYAILRDDKIKVFSQPQTHYFNCPVQLSKIPPSMRGGGVIHDTPDQAEVQTHELLPGDIVVIYTDGLSDNLPSEHIPLLSASLDRVLTSEINSHLSLAEQAQERARLLADMLVAYGRMAMARTGDEDGGRGWKTPFESEAAKAMPQWKYKGGKVDDITVITAVVSEFD